MGGRSAKLQKQIFPRSKTKLEAFQDKITGNNQSYPSIPASTRHVQVDPDYTPQYSTLLRNVAANIKSSHDNVRFKEYSMNKPPKKLLDGMVTPTGYLDREGLTDLFITSKGTPNLHEKLGLTSDELDKILSCYTGFKMQGSQDEMKWMNEMLQEANEAPHRIMKTPEMATHLLHQAETRRLKQSRDDSP